MAIAQPGRLTGEKWPQSYSERRFTVLLVILIVFLGGPPVLLGFGLSAGWFDGLTSLMMLAAILSLCFDRRQRLFALLLGIPTIILSLGATLFQDRLGPPSFLSATFAACCSSSVLPG